MKVKNVALVDLKGKPLKLSGTGTDTLVSDILADVACAPPPAGQSYQPGVAAERLKFARSVVAALPGDEIDVPTEMAAQLDQDVARHYPVIVSGQIHELLK